ncbi:MAG: molecular chaperone DnaK [Myxococcales bacterium]|nr:molecular chaperone DnaK [Myxococcales bacterium]
MTAGAEPHTRQLRQRLEALRDELRQQLSDVGDISGTVELDQARIGRLSRMDALQHQAMAKEQRRRAEERLERVLARLAEAEADDPDFGLCRDCLEPIIWARLEAIPDALFCTACQQLRGERLL